MSRLRRSDPSREGYRRRRRGRGFQYLDVDGRPIRDPETVQRVRDLVIPPAWEDVWICPDPQGHLQAVGTDQAGRRQYLYHPRWRERRDREKFDRMLGFAERLPRLRAAVTRDLRRPGLDRDRVLAAAVRLLDRGCFRIGTEPYAQQNGTFGLATIRRDHVRVAGDTIEFDYEGKGGVRVVCEVVDGPVAEVVRALRRRRGGSDELLAWKEGGRWRDVRSDDVNGYVKARTGADFTAKDFRTWHATVLAAAGLGAAGGVSRSATAQRRTIAAVVRDVADHLGNTPTVARNSYIDPRVLDRFRSGWTIAPALRRGVTTSDGRLRRSVEEAVVDLLEERATAPTVERVAA